MLLQLLMQFMNTLSDAVMERLVSYPACLDYGSARTVSSFPYPAWHVAYAGGVEAVRGYMNGLRMTRSCGEHGNAGP